MFNPKSLWHNQYFGQQNCDWFRSMSPIHLVMYSSVTEWFQQKLAKLPQIDLYLFLESREIVQGYITYTHKAVFSNRMTDSTEKAVPH